MKLNNFNIADYIKGMYPRIQYLLSTYPETQDYKILLLYYWKIFDGINIPNDVMQDIIANASEPNSISRYRRNVLEDERDMARDEIIQQIEEFTNAFGEENLDNTTLEELMDGD